MPQTKAQIAADGAEFSFQRIFRIAFWCLLACFEVLIFTMHLFPTGDGPLHIYYASVFHALIDRSSVLYAHYFAVRHLIQPYSIHYYVLICFRHFFSSDLSEKVFVGAILATVALGFRRLVGVLSTSSSAVVLCVFPLLLNWPLSIGAFNYSLAIGILLFALAEYYRLSHKTKTGLHLTVYCCLLILLVLAHPVPLLLLNAVLASDIALLWVGGRGRTPAQRPMRAQMIALLLACAAFAIPIMISDKAQVLASASDLRFHRYYVHYLLTGNHIRMFYMKGLAGALYDAGIVLLLPASLLIVAASGAWSRLRNGATSNADRLSIFTIIFLVATLFGPENMNGSSLFTVRLWLLCWILGLASMSNAVRGRLRGAVAAVAVGLGVWTLILANVYLRAAARRQAELETAPLPYDARGLFVQSPAGDDGSLTHTSYPINYWQAGRVFATHRDILLNSPWLQLTIMPIKENGSAGLLRDYTPLEATEAPNQLSQWLQNHPDAKRRALQDADFILFVDPTPTLSDPTGLAEATLGADWARWRCNRKSYYAVCVKK